MATPETERDRIRQAYLRMAEDAHYRPQAPGDGMGAILLDERKLHDSAVLAEEASFYADRFLKEAGVSGEFHIGLSNFDTNRAFVYTIEAARLLCCGSDSATFALKLLQMAAEEITKVQRSIQPSGFR